MTTVERLLDEWRGDIREAKQVARMALPDDRQFILARARLLEACIAQLMYALKEDAK